MSVSLNINSLLGDLQTVVADVKNAQPVIAEVVTLLQKVEPFLPDAEKNAVAEVVTGLNVLNDLISKL